MNKIRFFLSALICMLSLSSAWTYASAAVASGTCGSNLTWTLDNDGLLSIEGSGDMSDYSTGSAPWNSYSSSIKSISIGDNVTRIGKNAFYHCEKITSVSIGNSVTFIGAWAFQGCRALTSIDIPESVEKIAGGAFMGCTSFTSVTIPNSVTWFGDESFADCSNLTTVSIGSGVTTIGTGAFWRCSKLESIEVNADNTKYSSQDGVLFNKTMTSLIQYPLGKAGEYTIPKSITAIGSSAFSGSTALTKVIIPDYVVSIGDRAFNGCTGLNDIYCNIAQPLEITGYVFSGDMYSNCTLHVPTYSIASYSIAQNWKNFVHIESLEPTIAIGSCGENLTWVLTESGTLTIIGSGPMENYVFSSNSVNTPWYSYKDKIVTVEISENVTTIGDVAFYECINLASIVIPDAVTSIGDFAFFDCRSLKSISIGSGLVSIGANAFEECQTLEKVYIKDLSAWCKINGVGNLTGLAPSTKTLYINGEEVSKLEIPDGTTEILMSAFYGFKNITSVVIPSSVTSIGDLAFRNCINLSKVYNFALTPQTIKSSTFSVYDTLYVDASVISDYSNADFWKDFSIIKPIYIASGTCDNNLTWTLTEDGVLTISGTGEMAIYEGPWSAYQDVISKVIIKEGVTTIGSRAFCDCRSLTSIVIPNTVTRIENNAFQNCSSLVSIGDLPACTSIGSEAFVYCSSLVSVGNLPSCEIIDYFAFRGCSSLVSVGDLSSCKSIGWFTFEDCSSLESIGELPACTWIASAAFDGCNSMSELILSGGNVATLEGVLPVNMTAIVPGTLLADYREAPVWNEMQIRVVAIESQKEYDVEPVMEPTGSGLLTAIGLENMGNVMSLKVRGNINAYDIFDMRNNMPNLHKLDLSEAHIKVTENNFPYYGTTTTADSVLGDYAFYQQRQLSEIILPADIVSIGSYTFCESNIKSIIIPDHVVRIGDAAFSSCTRLQSVSFPDALTYIGSGAFSTSGLLSVELPKKLETIDSNAFYRTPIKELLLPSKLTSIGGSAFAECSSLMSVKATAVDSHTVTMSDDSFDKGTYEKATLYIPCDDDNGWDATFWNYYRHTQWGQFNMKKKWLPTYEDVLIGGDYTQETGTIPGDDITAEVGDNGGYIVGGDAEQDFGELNIENDPASGQGGSVIVEGDGEINVGTLKQWVNVAANKWYFFCFPYDVNIEDLVVKGQYVLYKYDGGQRADGYTGWVKLTDEDTTLPAGHGYIFQTNTACKILVPARNPEFSSGDKITVLEVYPANNKNDASWNLVGNPYLAYFNLEDLGYTAPITYWDGENYVAARPGDDDYAIQPMQAFFVQTTDDSNGEISFPVEGCETYLQSQNNTGQAKIARAQSKINPERLILNLVISDGENEDKTRVVFNDKQQMEYEPECDAAKFMSSENVPQLYSVYNNVQYAINERPVMNGDVQLGFKATKAGTYSIAMRRMDTPMLLKDNELGVTFDFANGEYTFDAQAGSNEHRFTLLMNGDPTAVKPVTVGDAESATYFNTAGQRTNASSKGIVIEKTGNSVKKVLNK